MVQLPFKKFRYAIKVAVSGALCLIALVAMRYWACAYRGNGWGGRHPSVSVAPPTKPVTLDKESQMYEDQILQDDARIISGLGEGGHPVYQVGDFHDYKAMKEASEQKFGVNAHLSDMMPYVRNLTDYRHPQCGNVTYDAELPSASVVIVFRAEPYSMLLRSVWAVLTSARRDQPWLRDAASMRIGYPGQDQRSPFMYLKEIILVDDNSTRPELKGKLSHYVRTRLPPDLIKILRLGKDSTGVVSARLAGARAARGDVLVFLDAHCEPQRDWLRPLLQRIKDRPHTVASPLEDVIGASDFEYKAKESDDFQVGGFTFGGIFSWILVSDREISRRGSDIAPTRSPILPTGLFAVSRRWFWKMGSYDDDMRGWGGENLEMSFRVWMCGGAVEVVPCSRVGHVYVKSCPTMANETYDVVGRNTARMSEVWMDDYKELFYLYRPDLRSHLAAGNVNYRLVVRKRLRCHSFNWYLEHVYPEKFVPVRDTYSFVRFYNPHSEQCLDTLQIDAPLSPLGLHPCHGDVTPSQFITLSLKGELRDEVSCADIHYSYTDGASARMEQEPSWRVVMMDCQFKTGSATWRYISGRLEHVDTGLCLDARGARPDAAGEARAARCVNSATQIWVAERLFSPERAGKLRKKQMASLLRIQRGNRVAPAQRDQPSTGDLYSTTSLL